MIIKTSKFIVSAYKKKQYPNIEYPEIVFLGRSNVGKSSLINTLVNRKKLAKISSTPGKTRSINFFLVNNKISLVDLPGYGYAKVSKNIKKSWELMVKTYLMNRVNLKLVLFLIDVRRIPTNKEIGLLEWFTLRGFVVVKILTKIDKLSKNKIFNQLDKINNVLSCKKSNFILFSSKKKIGYRSLWTTIENTLNMVKK